MKNEKHDYKKIDKIAISYGLIKTDRDGIYKLNGIDIDLTSSDNTDWAVAKNIIDSISYWVNR